MKSLKSPTEKLPYLLLATFLLISSANYFCSVKDNFISKNIKVASAETRIKTTDGTSLPVSAKLINPNNETTFKLPITRNPFRLSSNTILDVVKSNSENNLSEKKNYVAKSSYPVLSGTVISKEKSSIIAFYNGKSGYYELGDKIGSYELKSIAPDSIVVSKNGERKTIRLGENELATPTNKSKIPNSLNKKTVLPSINETLTNTQQKPSLTPKKAITNLQTIGKQTSVSSSVVQSSKIL